MAQLLLLRARRLLLVGLIVLSFFSSSFVMAFAPLPSSSPSSFVTARSSFHGLSFPTRTAHGRRRQQRQQQSRSTSSSLQMFLGSDGGLLGVGAPEVVTILLVGYFVLGPSDLYKLTKAIGKGIQNFRTLSSDVTKTFENNMENQLQLEELRKAQRELNDAFSFRRSINVDADAEAFSSTTTSTDETPTTTTDGGTATASETTSSPKRRKKKRRVKKKKKTVEETESTALSEAANGTTETTTVPPDLEMPAPWETMEGPTDEEKRRTEQELALRESRMERLRASSDSSSTPKTETSLLEYNSETTTSAQEQDRFVQQMSGKWNEQILANQDALEPLAKVMERLAILEEEKIAADARLEEEFRLRAELEEKFYNEKRAILEEAAADVQAGAYAATTTMESATTTTGSEEQQKKTA